MVLIESDSLRRELLARGLRDAGFSVVAVGSIAELERWPAHQVVVTESKQFTNWWQEVGAAHVVVLADDDREGVRCCRLGATLSLNRRCPLPRLVAAVRPLERNSFQGLATSSLPATNLPATCRERAAVIH
jgi:DNA-binding response OmpR family regulator